MKKIYLLFSHKLTDEQIEDANKNLNVYNFIYLPQNLQTLWSDIPPELETLNNYLSSIKNYLRLSCKKGDYVLIQGDFGAVVEMVEFSKNLGCIPVYATTKREVIETKQDDKIVKKSIFKHIRYRKY